MERVAEGYRRFAQIEAEGVSDVYYDWASSIAEDREVSSLIATLPGIKIQPNLVFAAARYSGAPVGPYSPFRDWLLENWTAVESVVLARATQTNEAARCAVLLPVLSRLDGPLALIEAGASAGLCLYPDCYSYVYDAGGTTVSLDPWDGPSPVTIPCTIDSRSVPTALPRVVHRSGVDLNPLDVTDDHEMSWLETLVWPEQTARRERIRTAAAIAAADPPSLVVGDLLSAIPTLIDAVPEGARPVVFHSSVLVYLPTEQRGTFAQQMLARDDVTWISNEGSGVFPFITDQVTAPIDGRTIVAVDGVPVALVGPHGQSYEALR